MEGNGKPVCRHTNALRGLLSSISELRSVTALSLNQIKTSTFSCFNSNYMCFHSIYICCDNMRFKCIFL